MAEGQGFEPWEARASLVFKTSAFDRSATPPGAAPIVSFFWLDGIARWPGMSLFEQQAPVTPNFEPMLKSLLRLAPFVRPYRARLTGGVVAFGFARFFEGLAPFFLAMGIDRVAEGDGQVTGPVLGIVGAVAARYLVVTWARYAVRTAGQRVAFDLRQRLYGALQAQGARFFANHTIGDMMTRAVADISLIQRLIAKIGRASCRERV